MLAYIVGTLLVLLVCVAVPLKYADVTSVPVTVLGIGHGYLYALMLLAIADLWRRLRFPLKAVALVALSGLVPFLTFYAERQITARVRDGRYQPDTTL